MQNCNFLIVSSLSCYYKGIHIIKIFKLFAVVGQPADLTALTVNQFSEIMIIETGEKIKTTNPEKTPFDQSHHLRVASGTLDGRWTRP